MSGATCATTEAVQSAVVRDGYAFVHGPAMREMLAPFGPLSDWVRFADSWNDLEVDTYMADGGRYRRRRYAAYEASTFDGVRRGAHQAHYQALDYNPLNGGVARWFEPVAADVGGGATMRAILGFCHAFFGGAAPAPAWRVEVHQFRIEARGTEAGLPTPEGLHRDGVDYVLVLLVQRRNIARGTTSIHGPGGQRLGAFTLIEPLDAALLDDARVAHGVTAVQPIDPSMPAYRDVLVVTFAALHPPA
ncbi:MAG: 2OG-Fe dioxygenase family protein [Acidobacteriota bacterium]